MAADAVRPLSVEQRESIVAPSLELATEIVTTVEGIRALKPDYEHLYRVTGNTLPFAVQEWHLGWCEHFLNRRPLVRESPRFCVLRSRTGACVALVPLILTRRRLGPLRVATLAPTGADPALTEIRITSWICRRAGRNFARDSSATSASPCGTVTTR